MSNSLFIEFLRRLASSHDHSESLYHEFSRLEDEILSGKHEALGPRHLLTTVLERGVLPMSHAHEEDALPSAGRPPFFHGHAGWGVELWGKLFGAVLKANSAQPGLRYGQGAFNLYPTDLKGECKDLAVFMALECAPFKSKGTKTLKFKEAIEKMVQHQQSVKCKGMTKNMLLVTSSWSTEDFQPWHGNFVDFRQDGVVTRLAMWTGNGCLESELG